MKIIKRISLLCMLMLAISACQAENYVEGKHYTKLAKPVNTQTGDKIEVLEFFWYGCPHCFHFEPTIKRWSSDLPGNVQFIRVPAPLNPKWMPHSKTYYALESMGLLEKHHDAIFNAIHVQKKRLFTREALADFLASRGVDKQTFLSNFDSFAVDMRARNAVQLGQQYQLNGVPTLTVNGKYVINAGQAGSYDAMIDIANFLITKEQKK